MGILIDPPAWPAHGMLWSHLISDSSVQELHEFASRLRVPRRSFDHDHYDVPEYRYNDAIELGARPVPSSTLVRALIDSGLRERPVDRARNEIARRVEFLHEQWDRLGARIGDLDEAEWMRVGTDLIARWQEPHRRYHDAKHLEDVLLALDHLEVLGERIANATLLAAWFHDAVYLGEPGDDERASADLAVAALTELDVEPQLVTHIRDMILATDPAQAATEAPLPLAHLLDADLAIFAAGEKRYRAYMDAVRTEYAHVPLEQFWAGRAAILERYLDLKFIYRTDAARRLWEARARENLAREIETLTS